MKVINLLFVSTILSSCSTRYQAEGLYDEGYEELQLAENMFRVNFRANKFTRKQNAIDFCLLRCAEISANHGYKYFSIVDQRIDVKSSSFTSPSSSVTTGSVNSLGGINAYTTNFGGQTFTTTKPSASNTILCYKEKPRQGIAYNTDFLIKSISEKYQITKFQTPNDDEQDKLNSSDSASFVSPSSPTSVKREQAEKDSRKKEARKVALRLFMDGEIEKEEYENMMNELK